LKLIFEKKWRKVNLLHGIYFGHYSQFDVYLIKKGVLRVGCTPVFESMFVPVWQSSGLTGTHWTEVCLSPKSLPWLGKNVNGKAVQVLN
jgi:hypothetical protein